MTGKVRHEKNLITIRMGEIVSAAKIVIVIVTHVVVVVVVVVATKTVAENVIGPNMIVTLHLVGVVVEVVVEAAAVVIDQLNIVKDHEIGNDNNKHHCIANKKKIKTPKYTVVTFLYIFAHT